MVVVGAEATGVTDGPTLTGIGLITVLSGGASSTTSGGLLAVAGWTTGFAALDATVANASVGQGFKASLAFSNDGG